MKLRTDFEAFSDHDLLSKNKDFNFPGLQVANAYLDFCFKLKKRKSITEIVV